jgi:dynein heavy chain
MFEVADLAVASPATVSRCGMVLLEPENLGWEVLIQSYCNEIKPLLEAHYDYLLKTFMWIASVATQYIVSHWKYPSPTDKQFLINQTLSIFDQFLIDLKKEDAKIPEDIGENLPNYIIFAFLWGIGGPLHEDARPGYEQFIQDTINGEDVVEKYKLIDYEGEYEPQRLNLKRLPEIFNSMFDLFFDNAWKDWSKIIPKFVVPRDVEFSKIIVPTNDSIRVAKLMAMSVNNKMHALFVGPTGTGKTISIANELVGGHFVPQENIAIIALSFSAQTSSRQTQQIIDGKMVRRRMGVYGPPLGNDGIIFVDDLNMPAKEEYGAQPPIELLRQWMDYAGWYDLDTAEKKFRKVESIRFVAAMGPPGGGRSFITERYLRHFVTIYVAPYSAQSLEHIFSNIMESLFLRTSKGKSFSKAIVGLKNHLVSSTIYMYEKVTENFKPTPTKSHYTYNLRDVSKVFQGIFFSKPEGVRNDGEMIKCWAHECIRVFHDRLISQEDRDKFMKVLKEVTKEKFKRDWEKLVTVSPLLFSSFVPTIYPDDDKNKKPMKNLY